MDDGAAMRVRRRGNSIRTLKKDSSGLTVRWKTTWNHGWLGHWQVCHADSQDRSAVDAASSQEATRRADTIRARDYYAPQKRDKRGRFAKGRAYDKRYGPNLPGEPVAASLLAEVALRLPRVGAGSLRSPTLSAVSGPVLGAQVARAWCGQDC